MAIWNTVYPHWRLLCFFCMFNYEKTWPLETLDEPELPTLDGQKSFEFPSLREPLTIFTSEWQYYRAHKNQTKRGPAVWLARSRNIQSWRAE